MDPQELVPLEAGLRRPSEARARYKRGRGGPPSCYQGPLRLCRLLVLVIVLPSLFVMVPLYLRYRVYLGQMYPMSMTDMRLIDSKISTTWCQRQVVRSNATFNAFVVPEQPQLTEDLLPVSMTRELELEDDMKEYWGFYLLRGSTVTVSSCVRWPGASLIMIKGYKHLQSCAYIGDDSSEELDELLEVHALGQISYDTLVQKIQEYKERKLDGKANQPETMKRHKEGVQFLDPNIKRNASSPDTVPTVDVTDHDPKELREILERLHALRQAQKNEALKHYKPPSHLMSLPALHRHRDTNVDIDERKWLSFKDIDGNGSEQNNSNKANPQIEQETQPNNNMNITVRNHTSDTPLKTVLLNKITESTSEGKEEVINVPTEFIPKGQNGTTYVPIDSVYKENAETSNIPTQSVPEDTELTNNVSTKSVPEEIRATSNVSVQSVPELNKEETIVKDRNEQQNKEYENKLKKEDERLVDDLRTVVEETSFVSEQLHNKKVMDQKKLIEESSREVFEDVLQKLQALGNRGRKVLIKLHETMGVSYQEKQSNNHMKSALTGSEEELERLRNVLEEAINEETTRAQRQQKRRDARSDARVKRELLLQQAQFEKLLNEDDEPRNLAAEENPDGFAEHHEHLNETTAFDMSNSEFWSSFSSSEEALLECEGLILNLPLTPHPDCRPHVSDQEGIAAARANALTYRVPANGYYFFVFNSENEVQTNYIRAKFDLQKTRYDIARSTLRECKNSTSRCDLTLDIFSNQKVVLEVPLRDNDSLWNEQFVIMSECEPRTSVYLFCVIAVPILILVFAFQ